MTGHGGRRTQADRDAVTVEIGYALCSAAFAALVVLGAVAGPALLFALPGAVETALVHSGSVLAALLFPARVAGVLLRFRRAARPGRSGRTGPDS